MSVDWANFTPVTAVIGGVLIGLGALTLMASAGRIAGISGILTQAAVQRGAEAAWRWAFLAGLIVAASVGYFAMGDPFPPRTGFPLGWALLAGGLVGFGTGVGSGCTSGHGVCGNARLSPRSIVATLVFVTVAVLTRTVLHSVLGWVP